MLFSFESLSLRWKGKANILTFHPQWQSATATQNWNFNIQNAQIVFCCWTIFTQLSLYLNISEVRMVHLVSQCFWKGPLKVALESRCKNDSAENCHFLKKIQQWVFVGFNQLGKSSESVHMTRTNSKRQYVAHSSILYQICSLHHCSFQPAGNRRP